MHETLQLGVFTAQSGGEGIGLHLIPQLAGMVWDIILAGGWLMWPLIGVALAAYGVAFHTLAFFAKHRFYKISRERLARAVFNPLLAEGELRTIIDYVHGDAGSPEHIRQRYREVMETYLGHLDRQRMVLFTLINVAPLMGLLGTVVGMLQTFRGLAVSAGGQTVDLIAGGISQALITTQAGLTIAIPGYVFMWLILRRRTALDAALKSMEVVSLISHRKGTSEEAA